jgi:transposase
MEIKDARSLSGDAQEALRMRAVQAVLSGMTQAEAAKVFGVSRYAVIMWTAAYREGGEAALAARKKGPKKGHGKKLTPKQERQTKEWVVGKCPDQLRLPFYLWTREAVSELIEDRFGVSLALSTVGAYLRDWGFTPQKPVRRAFEQSPAAVQRWLTETYPAIEAKSKEEGAAIYWGDETGLRSDHQTGCSYGLKGKTSVVPGTGQRFSINMISAITNRGKMSFMVYENTFRVPTFLKFLKRLVKQARRKVYLIVDGHPVHRAKLVQEWRGEHLAELEIFYLPGYSPELNPDELWNQDLKSNALGKRRPHTKTEMAADTRSYARSTQRRPDVVRSYFREEHVRYAA